MRPCVHKRGNSLVRLMNQGNSSSEVNEKQFELAGVRVIASTDSAIFITSFIRNGNKIMPFYEKTLSVRCTN